VSEVPVVSGRASLTRNPTSSTPLDEAVAQAFEPGAALAQTLPGFEPRAGQVEMAAAVARAFVDGGVLLAEAGTGTGKTVAYLVPAILSRQRVLISTGTKNLQEQIFFKDIPALRDALGVPFTAAYMKGRANYLCLHRLDQLSGEAQSPAVQPGARDDRFKTSEGRARDRRTPAPDLSDVVFLPIIREWSKRTETGDRAELQDLPEDWPFWNEVSATIETCIGTECPRYDECFVTRMRQRAAAADLVIVNHHLLCADAAVRQNAYGEVIPACANAILDEAHQIEDVATQYFGVSLSTHRVEDFARDVERAVGTGALAQTDRDAVTRVVDRVRSHARDCFTEVSAAHRGDGFAGARAEERVRATPTTLLPAADAAAALAGAFGALESALALTALKTTGGSVPGADATADDDGQSSESETLRSLARRAGQLKDDVRFLMRADDAAYVYFVEFRGRAVFLRASPIDVADIVRELVLDRMRTTVLTSATLAVDDSFDYIRTRLGIRKADEVRLASEFDYTRQAVLYLPRRMPDPRSPDFTAAAGREVIEILRRTRGRAFVLFTSYAGLRAVQALAEMALEYPILIQGTAPRSQLLQQFRATPHAVLFATSSFWQGVDVVGEALSCVIVDRLPFASPSDPVTGARIDAIRAQGGEPFSEYQVPLAILALQQGLGRLIRHRGDRGVLAVLDPRLRTKGYGRRFMASLPPAPVVHELEALEAFLVIGAKTNRPEP
jgi:ATP-dependent DNA helicase DinG